MSEVTSERSMLHRALRDQLVWVAMAIVAISFATSDGLFIIDELIYVLGTHSLIDHGSLVVQTGYDQFHSRGLKLIFLVSGQHGLVPQYPPGYNVLAAPFVALLGIRGFILINAVAAAATAFLIRALIRELFPSTRAALIAPYLFVFGTFSLEYAFGIWPQMLSTALVAAAVLSFAQSLRPSNRYSFASGLVVGCGMLIRLDAVLLLPAFMAYHVIETRRPVKPIALLALGLVPATVLLCAANLYKFGTFNPLSYGHSGGGTDLRTYFSLFALLPPSALFLLFLRRNRSDGLPAILVLVPAGILIVVAGLTGLFGNVVSRSLTGAYALLIDITHISKGDRAAVYNADGTVLFYGMPKKALAQSMPWLGIAPLLLVGRDDENRRRGMVLLLLVCAFWIAPFAFKSWYGGMASNMRYFLPIVPLLCILAAASFDRLPASVDISNRKLLWAYVVGILATLAVAVLTANGLARAEQVYTPYIFLALVIMSFAFALPGLASLKTNLGKAILLTFAACAGTSSIWATVDVATAQAVRHSAKATDQLLDQFPKPFIVFGGPDHFPSVFQHYPSELGSSFIADCRDEKMDCATLDFALVAMLVQRGYRILVHRPAISNRIRQEIQGHGLKLAESTGSAAIDSQFAEITH